MIFIKQHITVEQTKELSEKATKRIIAWALEHSPQNWQCRCPCKCPLLSIGQMIEFLDEHKYFYGEDVTASFWLPGLDWREINKMCDFLWEAVKEVLEK